MGRGIAQVCAREGARVAFTFTIHPEQAEATLALVQAHGEGLSTPRLA